MRGKVPQRVTLRDIANATGYSVNTISKALRDMPDLSAQTKAAIQETACNMGYVMNNMASALRSGYSGVLALIVSDISNPFFGILCKEIEQQAAKYHYTVIVFNTEEQESREEQAIRTALSKNVDGVLLTPSQHSTKSIELLMQWNKPCVLIGRYFPQLPADAVLFDDENGGYLAGKHLIERGYNRILMLNAPHNSSAVDRALGFNRAMEESNVSSKIITLDSPLGGISQILTQEYTQFHFDAIFAYSDLLAMEAVACLQQMGVAPHSIGIVGFDDIQSRLALPFPLTSISVGKAAFGEALVSLLMKRIDGGNEESPICKVLPTQLIVRNSTPVKQTNVLP